MCVCVCCTCYTVRIGICILSAKSGHFCNVGKFCLVHTISKNRGSRPGFRGGVGFQLRVRVEVRSKGNKVHMLVKGFTQ